MTPDRNDLPPWYRPAFTGFAGRLGDLALAGRQGWTIVAPSSWGGFSENVPTAAVTVHPVGSTRVYEVNVLDPGTGDGLVFPAGRDKGQVVPARRL